MAAKTPNKKNHAWTLEEKDAIVDAVRLGHETGAQIKNFLKWKHLTADQINGKMKHMRSKGELAPKEGLIFFIIESKNIILLTCF